MKARKAAGGVLFGIGCAAAFMGLLATVLPLIANDQLRLVLSSFAMPSENGLVNAINAAMTYALGNCYMVLLAGIAMMAVGIALLLWRDEAPKRKPPRQRGGAPAYEGITQPAPHAQQSEWPEPNPFADFSVQELLTPRAQPQPAGGTPSYAPPILPNTADALFQDASPYERPAEKQVQEQTVPAQSRCDGEPIDKDDASAPASVPPTAEITGQSIYPGSRPMPKPQQEASPNPSAPVYVPGVEAGAPSQSGSKVMIRSTFQTSAPEEKEETPVQQPSCGPEGGMQEYTPNEESAPRALSPRIKSTMGRHTL